MYGIGGIRWQPRYVLRWVALWLTLSYLPAITFSEEIAPFRLMDVEGFVALRYRADEQSVGSSGATASTEEYVSMEEEVFVLTHSYIYHPNFLKLDLGGGPLLIQNELESTAGNTQSDESLYNLTARLRFLEEKPYPLVLYYDRENPSVSLSLTDRFLQKVTKYGMNFQLRQPVIPFTLDVEAFNQQTKGEGFDLVINDEVNQASVRAHISIGKDGYGQIAHTTNQLDSNTGLRSSTIQTTKVRTDTTSFDSRFNFGAKKEFTLSNLMSYSTQEELNPRREFRFSPDLRWHHSDRMLSSYRYNLFTSKQTAVETTNQNAAVGITYDWTDRLSFNGDIHAEDNETTGLMLNSYGASAGVSYRHPLDFGTLRLSAGMRYDYFDRKVTANVPVRDVNYTLSGTTAITLPHDSIIVATIQVRRDSDKTVLNVVENGTCTPTTNIDIVVTTIGLKTQIAKCLSTANNLITPSEDTSLVIEIDYDYDPGGTAEYTNFDQTYQADLDFLRYYNVFARFRDNSSRVVSGTPTTALNDLSNTQFGARLNYPFWNNWQVGAEYTIEEQSGESSSFERNSFDTHLQFPLLSGTLYLNHRKVEVDNLNSVEDINLVRNSARYRARPWYRAILTVEISDEKDTGGTTPRRSRLHTLKAEWRIRKLTLAAEGRFIEETQGGTQRDRSVIKATLRRDF